MGRFSPTVKPTAAPTGLGSLAQALQSGIAGYQGAQDRMEGQMDRQRKRVIETDTLASQGLVPNLPETPETFGSAFSRALSGAPEPETQPEYRSECGPRCSYRSNYAHKTRGATFVAPQVLPNPKFPTPNQ